MRLLAILCALAGSIITVVVVRSSANDQPTAAKPKPGARAEAVDDPFGESDDAPQPTKSTAARPAPSVPKPSASSAEPFDEVPLPELRPYPRPIDSLPRPTAQPASTVETRRATGAPTSGGSAAGGTIGGMYIPAAMGMGQAEDSARPLSLAYILTPEMADSPQPVAPIELLSASGSAAVARINAALASPTEIDCKDMPLRDVVAQLKKLHKIEIQLDNGALKDAGIDESTPVTKHVKDISLRSALRLLLGDFKLKYVINNEVLLITSPERSESDEFMVTEFYPVKDLVLIRNEHDEIQADFQPLMDLLVNAVETKSWLDNGGNGTVSSFQIQDQCLLVISQTQEAHEEIVEFLASVRRCCPADAKGRLDSRLPKLRRRADPRISVGPATQPPAVAASPSGTSATAPAPTQPLVTAPQTSAFLPSSEYILTPEMAASREPQTATGEEEAPSVRRIREALKSPTVVEFKETPLKEVFDYLMDAHKIEIQLDSNALRDAGIEEVAPVTKCFKGVPLRSALRLLLDDLKLTYVIHNDVLLITSPERAESDDLIETKIYPVKDLILVRNQEGEIETDFQSLVELIQNTIAARTWMENGGRGAIAFHQHQDHSLLVVSQTQEVQEQIADFLAALRRCGATDAKSGNELRLPKRPKAVAPTYYAVPAGSSPPSFQGGGWM